MGEPRVIGAVVERMAKELGLPLDHLSTCVWHRNIERGILAFDCNCGAYARQRADVAKDGEVG